ncbi:rRNA N6-adenosine-methyltransferase ZCCHC4 [Chelonus insularis]|uniref:rRNA N6-adenosine-methyltransferase ZCCHC4 n=1 Tax=Chelonus insularis TaxID=460826 RepID=UPI00158B394A|nr:rRNA N6-adenosine-methyltransferase ZCCHC4 [Chelonus insularis]
MIINEQKITGILNSNISEHPKCAHGPTLLFQRTYNDNKIKYFYACSACRDRKLCNFYLEKDQQMTLSQKKLWDQQLQKLSKSYNHQKCFIRFNQLLCESPDKRLYCHTCEELLSSNDSHKHTNHELTFNLTDDQMMNPTTFLRPLSDAKKEAQYLFSTKATVDIVDMILNQGIKHVLCIGAPRIHEFLTQHYKEQVSSLLLDFDKRFHNFFGPLEYCWYNLFNNYFFKNESKQVFKDFLTQNNGKDILLICDPPFGGRVEFISQTLRTISDLHKKWNKSLGEDELKIMFIFPYFMESIMKFKANPTDIDGGLKNLRMTDYKVDYDNHPLFITESNTGRKYGSPVRLFTNIPLHLLKLPEKDGYRYCKKCLRWVSAENKHCKKCKECTSKDGRQYQHCNKCQKCVKPTWKHCEVCQRCALENHSCEIVQQLDTTKHDLINKNSKKSLPKSRLKRKKHRIEDVSNKKKKKLL